MSWLPPRFVEIKMDAEIGSYQEERDDESERSRSEARHKARRFPLWGAALVALVVGVACGSQNSPGFGNAGGPGGDGTGSSGGGGTSGGGTSRGGSSGSFGVMGSDDGGPPPSSGAIPTNLPAFVKDDTGKSGLPAATITQLKMGGSACSSTILYPYQGTVLPAEGLPPIIQWSGSADAVYVKMTYGDTNQVLYEAAGAASNPGRFQMNQTAWNAVSVRTPQPPAPRAPLQVTLTVKSGSTFSTCQLKWYVAPGALTGSLYYNTYDDPTATAKLGFAAGNQGSVMRLQLGKPSPDVFLVWTGPPAPMSGTGPCYGCHSVSARGSTMLASLHDYGYNSKSFKVFGYDVQSNPSVNPPPVNGDGYTSASFAAITPDGKYLLTMGNPDCTAGAETFPRAPNNMPTVEGSVVASLWDVKAGKKVQATGLDPKYYMWMPQFSALGDKIVFNHAKPGANGRTDRRELATMDFNESTLTFSNLQVLYHDDGPAPSLPYGGYSEAAGAGPIPTGANGCTQNVQPSYGTTFNDTCTDVCYPGWPFFTPDGKKVIFVRGTQPDFSSFFPGSGRTAPSKSLLYVVDTTSKVARPLVAANAGAQAQNLGYEYFTTVMPVAAGGQFWAFFTSRRTFGNTQYPGLANADSKKIWVTAIDIGAPDNVDPSHPPFYLMGQGSSGNIRAFPSLNPCKADGQSCASGLDCCGGTCMGEGAMAMCGTPVPGMCSALNSKCASASDCCDKTQQCIGGYCAVPPQTIQ